MNTDPHRDLMQRLDELHAKVDYLVDRQRILEELVDEMTPIARDALGVAAGRLGELEQRGYMAVGKELMGLADRVVAAYGPQEVHRLGEHIVSILDTLRNLTQPDVLAVANEATDVLHHAHEVEPVGMFKMARATGSDEEVRRGMGVALEILRQLGRARGGDSRPVRSPQPPPTEPPSAGRSELPPPAATVRPSAVSAPEPEAEEIVEWEGVRFTPEGFLLDRDEWTEELAHKMAAALGLELGEEHLLVLLWIREDHASTGASPNVRRMGAGSGVGTKRLYELFPRTPGKTAARLAGVPKPVGCV